MSVQIYLDTSVYNRPFDDQSQPRIWLETLALSVILRMVEQDEAVLISSSVIAYETSRNPNTSSKQWIAKVTQTATAVQRVDERIRQRALVLETFRIKAMDALHVACAEAAGAQYFVTCDDRLIRRYREVAAKAMTICEPTEFVRLVSVV